MRYLTYTLVAVLCLLPRLALAQSPTPAPATAVTTWASDQAFVNAVTARLPPTIPGNCPGCVLSLNSNSTQEQWAGSVGGTTVVGTNNQILATPLNGTTTLSLTGPYSASSYTPHATLLGEGSAPFSLLGPCPLGSLPYGEGASADPVCSSTIWPNVTVTGDILFSSSANNIGSLADVATGQVLTSGGVGVAPLYSASPALTGLSLTTPLNTVSGGTECAGSVAFASLPASPDTGTTCLVNDATSCTAGTQVTAGSSTTKCQVVNTGTPGSPTWFPAGGATSAAAAGFNTAGTGLTSAGQTVSLISPVTATNGGTGVSAPTAHEIPIAEGSSAFTLISCSANLPLVGQGGSADPVCQLLNLTNGVTGILPIANGGTNASSAATVAGTGITVSGTFPNQTVNIVSPVTLANGGTQCTGAVAFAGLPASPPTGTMCTVTNATACTLGTPVTSGGGSTVCPVVNIGTPGAPSWSPAGGATAPASGGFTTAGTGLSASGSTISLATPVAVANGGTGSAAPALVAGTNVTITGVWPNQTINASLTASNPCQGSTTLVNGIATVTGLGCITGSNSILLQPVNDLNQVTYYGLVAGGFIISSNSGTDSSMVAWSQDNVSGPTPIPSSTPTPTPSATPTPTQLTNQNVGFVTLSDAAATTLANQKTFTETSPNNVNDGFGWNANNQFWTTPSYFYTNASSGGNLGKNADFQLVDGNYTGTTQNIIRWAAAKNGVDEDWAYAESQEETSGWRNDCAQMHGGTTCNEGGDCNNPDADSGGETANLSFLGFTVTNGSSVFTGSTLFQHGANGASGTCNTGSGWASWGIIQSKVNAFEWYIWPMVAVSTAWGEDYRWAKFRSCVNGDYQQRFTNDNSNASDYASAVSRATTSPNGVVPNAGVVGPTNSFPNETNLQYLAAGCVETHFSGGWYTAGGASYLTNFLSILNNKSWPGGVP